MDNLLTIALEAHNEQENHHRRYEISVGRDLLDAWTVSIRYGRAGQGNGGAGGTQLRFAAHEPDQLRGIIRTRLRRRLSAPHRIGCPYRVTLFSAAPGIDSGLWVPKDLLGEFLG